MSLRPFPGDYGGSYSVLLASLLPSCREVVLQCQVGREAPRSGGECCSSVFDPRPHLTEQVTSSSTPHQLHYPCVITQGTCFVTQASFPLSSGGLTVVTQHDSVELDPGLASPEILGARVGWSIKKVLLTTL